MGTRTGDEEMKSGEMRSICPLPTFEAILDNVPALVCVVSSAGLIEYANQPLRAFLGRAGDELCGKGWAELLACDSAATEADWRNRIARQQEFVCFIEYADAAGARRTLQARFRPESHGHLGDMRWFAVLEDVTEKRRTEEALRKEEEQFQTLLDAIPAMVWRAGPNGEMEYMNRRLGTFVGLSIDEINNQPWCALIHPEDREVSAREWSAALENRASYDGTFRYRRADGVFRRVRVIGEPFHDVSNDANRWYGLYIDVENEKALEEALGSSQLRLARATQLATIAELSASIAHEVNQPLAAVAANAEACMQWLASSPPNVQRATAAAQRIRRDGGAAAEVVRRVRALFKQEAPKIVPLPIEEVILEVLRLVRRQNGRPAIEFATSFESPLPLIAADKLQMQQVLMNLVTNALEAMDELNSAEKRVSIAAHTRKGGYVTIEVSDQGKGLQELALIFEPFVTSKERGMGIGLSLCRSIVHLHGGELWATHNDPLPGATLHFTVPVYGVPLEPTSQSALADQTVES
jgi:PAS domain S-box-containing protein